MSDGMRASLGALSGPGGFRSDSRFAPPAEAHPPAAVVHEPEDPLAVAFAEGYAAGAAKAQANAEYQANEIATAREALNLSFDRLDKELEEELRLRLRDTVVALCESAIAPLALDQEALLTRVQRAVAMLARADDDRVIRLHPDDLVLISPQLAADWEVLPDPTLERGALRIETSSGGVEDGPEQWRLAIAEALHQC
jgi:flagellar assembly protein FliH